VPAFGQLVDAFLLHPFGDLDKSVETGAQSSLQPVYALSTAGNRIIGILAAVALPAYSDYTVRAKTSEVMLAASGAKTGVAEAAAAYSQMPDTASFVPVAQVSKYVSGVTYAIGASSLLGVITATASGDAKVAGSTITMSGAMDPSTSVVVWTCGGTIDQKYRPSSCK
jgi:type IV pilus assembly protein PilA